MKITSEYSHYFERVTRVTDDLIDEIFACGETQQIMSYNIVRTTVVTQLISWASQGYLLFKRHKILFIAEQSPKRFKLLHKLLPFSVLLSNTFAIAPLRHTATDFEQLEQKYQTLLYNVQSFRSGRLNNLASEQSEEAKQEAFMLIKHFMNEKEKIDAQKIVLSSIYKRIRRSSDIDDQSAIEEDVSQVERQLLETEKGEIYSNLKNKSTNICNRFKEIAESGFHREFAGGIASMFTPALQLFILASQLKPRWFILSLAISPASTFWCVQNFHVCKTNSALAAYTSKFLKELQSEIYLNVRTSEDIEQFTDKLEKMQEEWIKEMSDRPIVPLIALHTVNEEF
jgi:hypothetical protein